MHAVKGALPIPACPAQQSAVLQVCPIIGLNCTDLHRLHWGPGNMTIGGTAVMVLILAAPAPVNVTDVSAQQPGGAAATVTNVWPFPNQA